jgi:hypothetical protein
VLLQGISETIEWIYGEGANAANELYKKKFEEFKVIGQPVKER